MCACAAVDGVAGTEGGPVHLTEVHAAAAITGNQHAAVCPGTGCTLSHPRAVHSLCQLGCPAHGTALGCLPHMILSPSCAELGTPTFLCLTSGVCAACLALLLKLNVGDFVKHIGSFHSQNFDYKPGLTCMQMQCLCMGTFVCCCSDIASDVANLIKQCVLLR